ncbi:STAS domain-containing protein [Amycolatopsis suaedae]|nr:STAS domain-containing protein [Amycolatopsis suaedae]
MSHLACYSRADEEATVLVVSGDVDTVTAPALAGQIRARLTTPASTVVVDLDRVAFLGVSGLRVLISAYRQARRDGVDLRIAATSGRIRHYLTVAGLSPALR